MIHHLKQNATWVAVFAAVYVAVLPMAGTIALRNVSLLALIICLVWALKGIRTSVRFSRVVWLWAAYLLVFPLFASDHATAWSSFTGQWGRGLLAMAVGAGTALVLAGRISVFALGLVSAVPLAVHLVLVAVRFVDTGSIPWNYWGRETHHADLGYAAGHVVIFMTASVMNGTRKQQFWALAISIASACSLVVAQSRAGLVFSLLGCGLVLLVGYRTHAASIKRHALSASVVVLGLTAILAYGLKEDPRWRLMGDRLAAGWIGNAIATECLGTPMIAANIATAFGDTPEAEQLIESVRNGDGSRVVLLRAGLELALKNPWGSDGSRQAYQKLLIQECPNPAIVMAHTHNGWIDTMLAIGILGAVLYACVLLRYAYLGLAVARTNGNQNEWALVLFAVASFWLFRGLTDSVFRDHMLEMQGFVLALALMSNPNMWHRRRIVERN